MAYYPYKENQKKKQMFHKPQKTGEMRKIPTPVPVWILSIVSLVLLVALTVFAVIGATNKSSEVVTLGPQLNMNAGLLYLFLPVIAWIIALLFRLALRFIPLEMWRLPMSVREATIKTEGKYLKIATLLIELETVICFGYITLCIFQGHAPADVVIIIWVAAVVFTIIFFGRYVLKKAEEIA